MKDRLKLLWAKWLDSRFVRFGRKIAAFFIRIVFTVAYFIVIIPFGMLFRIFSKIPEPGWHDVEGHKSDIDDARRQY